MNTQLFTDRLTPAEVAVELNVTIGTLAVWRTTKRYPLPWYRLGRHVYYSKADVLAFIQSQRHGERPSTASQVG